MENVKENKGAKEELEQAKKERKKSESHEVVQFDKDGKKEVHITLSPKLPASDAPESDELIKALQALENAASSDGKVREQIAQLPPEVSDVTVLSKISGSFCNATKNFSETILTDDILLIDQTEAESLRVKVNEAVQLLADYNGRLLKEMEDRKSLTKMLHDFTASQKELLVQADERLQVILLICLSALVI